MLGPLAVEDNGKKSSGSPPAARLPLLFRSPPTLPPLIMRNPSRDPSPSSRTGPAPHQTVSHFEDRASPRKSKEHGHGCPPGGDYFPPGYKYPPWISPRLFLLGKAVPLVFASHLHSPSRVLSRSRVNR